MGQRRGAVENPQRAASRHRGRDAGAVRGVRIHAVSGAARRVAIGPTRRYVSGADAGLCVEGGARGQAGNQLAQSQRNLRGGIGDLYRSASAEFLESLETLAQRVALLGALNSLSQVTLKATMPGVPDFYQGTEFWDLSLVDSDNRRPVEFAERATVLALVENPDWGNLAQHWPDGHIKLAWTRHLLKLRTELAELFARGDYQPLEITGPHGDHVIAFARRLGRDA